MTSDRAGKGPPGPITLAFTGLTHVLLGAPVLYILVLAFTKYSFFSWHPIAMSLGVGLLITEAVFSISGEAYLGSRLSRQKRVTAHWVLHSVGLLLVLVGLIIIIVNKVNHSKPHFATPHSILGLVSIILAAVAAAVGVLTNNTRWLYPRVRPVLLKIFHAFGGIVVTILLLATLITGTYTGWWPGGPTGRGLTFASLFIAGVLILLKPLLGAISRSKVAFAPPSNNS